MKKIFLAKKTLLSFFAFLSFVVFVPRASADAWGSAIMAELFGQQYRIIHESILGAMLAAAKKQAVIEYNKTVTQIVSGGPLFITDWEQFLIKDTRDATEIYMNDFFTDIAAGKNSSLNYEIKELKKNANEIKQNYANKLVEQAKQSIFFSPPSYNLNEHIEDPTYMFADGNWKAWNAFILNPANNPIGFSLMSQDIVADKLENERKKAELQAIAYQGYMSKSKDGKVLTPGSTIKDIISQAEDLPNKILANARSLPEVIVTLLIKQTGNTLRQGIGGIQTKLQREVNTTINNYTKSMQNITPGQKFKPQY